MKKAFYYLRYVTPRNEIHPYGCVCVAKSDEGIISRGIAICSPDDHFSKEIGRAKALGYATRALNEKNVQIEKRSKIAGRIIDNVVGAPVFPGVDSIKGQLKGKYLQSSTLLIPNSSDCAAVPSCFIPLTSLERKLLENG